MEEVITLSSDDEETFGEQDVFEIDEVCDVRLMNRVIQYKIAWIDSVDTTWEPESNFMGPESIKMLLAFKEKNKEKIDELIQTIEKKKKKKVQPEDDENDSIIEEPSADEDSLLAPRELTEEDNFYGKPVKELQGESKRLFDPTHKQSTTDLLLAQMGTSGRVSRSKAAELKKVASDQGFDSRPSTPSQPVTPPKQPAKRRGRPKLETTLAQEPKKKKVTRKTKKVIEDEEEKPQQNEEPSTSSAPTARKRIIDEDDYERKSETPEPEKTKFFINRDDEEDSEELWAPKINAINPDPIRSIQTLMQNMVCRSGSLIELILKGDLVSARILYKKMDVIHVREMIIQFKDQHGRPLLHTLIHSTKATSNGMFSSLATMRFVLSISRQYIFCIPDENDNIAMHEAVRVKHYYAVRLLANCGSMLMKKNKQGQTPFDLAILNGDRRTIKFLLNRGVTFHGLLSKSPSTPVRQIVHQTPYIMQLIQETHSMLKTELQRMRRRIYKKRIQDIRAVSDVLIAPRHDNNDVVFYFDYNAPKMENINQGHLLMVFPVVYSAAKRRWICSSSTTRFCGPPNFNNMYLKHAQNRQNPTVFYAVPKIGTNYLKLQLSNNNWNSEMAITAQLVRYEMIKSPPPQSSSSFVPSSSRHAPPTSYNPQSGNKPPRHHYHKKY